MDKVLQSVTANLFARNGIPLKLIRILPLILTTVLFVNRVAQYFAITTFMPPHMPIVPASSNAGKRFNPAPILRVWLRTSVARIFPGVLAVVLLLRVALLLNLLVRPADFSSGSGRMFYGIAFIFSFAHLPLAPKMLKIENGLKSPQSSDEEVYSLLQGWFRVNNMRIWLVDFPLWLVAIAATLGTIKL